MKILTLIFPFGIPPYALSAFRGAINELVEPKSAYFHNHNNDSGDGYLHWDYPRIRYSLYKGHAAVTGIEEGILPLITELLPRLLAVDYLLIDGQPYGVAGFRLEQREAALQWCDEPQAFGMHRWVALNKANYRQWKKLEGNDEARKLLLGRALTGQLGSIS